ncbi:MAG: hypothetical protein Q9213_004211 [Squamulea squamosa]
MATVLNTSPPLDPSRSARIPISIGESFLGNEQGTEQRSASIQWNYKPPVRPYQTTRIKPSRHLSESRVDLTIKNQEGDGEYNYKGAQHDSGACALIYNASANAFVLEKINVDITFNLQTSPFKKDRNEVTSQYPQLDTGVSDVESDNGTQIEPSSKGSDPAEPDMGNPYDYRHFLKRRRTSSPEAQQPRPNASPTVPPRRLSRTGTKPKPRPRPVQRPKRPPPSEEAKQNSDDSDDGGLTIEMGDDPKPRRFGNGAVVFNHDRSKGPISLRSAASSMSPASIRHDSGNEDVESDKDVDHLQLPSPAGRSNVYAVDEEEADNDDDDYDDVVDDLIEAMESQEEEEEQEADSVARVVESQPIRRTVEESSSESEEE